MAISRDRANGLRRVATVVVVLALFVPVLRDQDGLPLSTYPMYAGTRGEVLEIVVAYGVSSGGSRIDLTMPQIADTRDPLIAQSFLNDSVSSGAAGPLCDEIAQRVGSEVSLVEIATERRNVVEHAAGRASLVDRSVVARCAP